MNKKEYTALDPEKFNWIIETFNETLQSQRENWVLYKPTTHLVMVDSFFITALSQLRVHSLFNKAAIEQLSDLIFMNDIVRDFILTLTDKLTPFLVCFDTQRFEANLAGLISNYNKENHNSLVPANIFNSLTPSIEFPILDQDIVKFLINNTWLVVVITSLLYTTESSYQIKEN